MDKRKTNVNRDQKRSTMMNLRYEHWHWDLQTLSRIVVAERFFQFCPPENRARIEVERGDVGV